MTDTTTDWLHTYLQKLCGHPLFTAARSVAPLWLVREGAGEHTNHNDLAPSATRVTIQMAAELSTRMALIGPAGAGKTTLLRQLAIGLAEQFPNIRQGNGRGDASTPIPLYIELARFAGSIESTLAAQFEIAAPTLDQLARERPLLFLLDGLDELAPSLQLTSLAMISATIAALGTQARWIAACRSESLALFRPWLGAVEVRAIRPLLPRDVLGAVQQHNPDLAAYLQRAEDLVSLASRPRWLAGLLGSQAAAAIPPAYSRGRLLSAWVPAVVAATLEAHPQALEPDVAMLALPALASAMAQRQS